MITIDPNTSFQDDVRTSLTKFNEYIRFSYGRNLDNAFETSEIQIDNYLVCLDPPNYSGSLVESNETKNWAMSWLRLDNADSSPDKELNISAVASMEEIVKDCHDTGLRWLKQFAEDYSRKYSIDSYTGFEAFKVKHLVTGFVFQFNVSAKTPC